MATDLEITAMLAALKPGDTVNYLAQGAASMAEATDALVTAVQVGGNSPRACLAWVDVAGPDGATVYGHEVLHAASVQGYANPGQAPGFPVAAPLGIFTMAGGGPPPV